MRQIHSSYSGWLNSARVLLYEQSVSGAKLPECPDFRTSSINQCSPLAIYEPYSIHSMLCLRSIARNIVYNTT